MFSRWLLAAAVVLALVGCFNPKLDPSGIKCGPGDACPTGFSCYAAVCRPTDCSDLDDRTPCSNGIIGNGWCVTSTCVARGCGDTIVEGDEVCDDGNDRTGDGCSLNCSSDETCGNGEIDFAVGEACESPVAGLSGTGCSSACTREQLSWRDLTFPSLPPHTGALTYDSYRKVVVMFGSLSSTESNQTWEYDGQTWRRRSTIVAPSPRSNAMMAFDSDRRKVVLFGGTAKIAGLETKLDDTWTYDGNQWHQVNLLSKPKPRAQAGMVFDPIRKKTILFGGATNGTSDFRLGDTWTFDGSTWSEVLVAGPSVRSSPAMAFDTSQGHVVLFGGEDDPPSSNPNVSTETWFFDGQRWIPTTIASVVLPASGLANLAYDAANSRVVLRGQCATCELWELLPDQWKRIDSSNSPMRIDGNLVYDSAHSALLLLGRELPSKFVSGGWAETPPAANPGSVGADASYDVGRGVTVTLATAQPGSFATLGTWELEPDGWRENQAASTPLFGVDDQMVMSYDENLHETILLVFPSLRGFSYNGRVWSSVSVANLPSFRSATLSYNPDIKKTILYGVTSVGVVGMTWLYDGVEWTQLSAPSPPSRSAFAIAYDSSCHQQLMFGGVNASGQSLNDLWAFDGEVWKELHPAAPLPAPRRSHSLVYDTLRRKTMLVGGTDGQSQEAWQLEANNSCASFVWSKSVQPTNLPSLFRNVAVMDRVAGELVFFGGMPRESISRPVNSRLLFSEDPAQLSDRCAFADTDSDNDGRFGCGPTVLHPTAKPDPDCWGRCTPFCPPTTEAKDPADPTKKLKWPQSCAVVYPGQPYCGDGVCSTPLETPDLCVADCR
jgi:cysteine-rich repeat protein